MADSQEKSQTPVAKDFMRLFVEHEPRLYAYIHSLVPNRADAENVLQETASVLWEKFSQFQPGTSFLSWASTVARYQVLYFRQQQKRNVLQFSQEFVDAVDEAAISAVSDTDQFNNLRTALDACLKELSDADRELFRLRYQPGAKVPAIATSLGRPVTTVYHALDRIRRQLVDCIERRAPAKERS
jgi:RNA polymerase sigma-70 factor (ECF subfamily)